MLTIEHIGIAVKDLAVAKLLYEKLLNTSCYKTEVVASENVNIAFFKQGNTKIELLEGMAEESAIAKFIGKRGEGLYHIAFEVEDIVAEMQRLQAAGFTLINEQPKRGADNKLVCFLHPKDACGVLVELCQEIR